MSKHEESMETVKIIIRGVIAELRSVAERYEGTDAPSGIVARDTIAKLKAILGDAS